MELRRRLLIALTFLLLVFLTGTMGFYLLGPKGTTVLDATYMTVITLSTVGYGEVVNTEHSAAARVFTMILILAGAGILLFVMSTATAFIVEGQLSHILRRRKMQKEISGVSDHYIVCGGGETGHHVVEELTKSLHNIVMVDVDEDRMVKLREHAFPNLLYYVGDATDDDVLLAAGIRNAKGIVIALPHDKDNLYVTITARQLNPKLRIVVQGVEAKIKPKLLNAGANSVVSPHLIGGLRMASEMIRPTVVSFLDTMIRHRRHTWRIEEIPIRTDSPWASHTLAKLDLRARFNVLCVAIRGAEPSPEGEEPILFNPASSETIPAGGVLVVMGEVDQIRKAREAAGSP